MYSTRRVYAFLLAIAMVVVCGSSVVVAQPLDVEDRADALLSQRRWVSERHSLSIRPPLGSRVLEMTEDQAVVRMIGDTGYNIHVYVKESRTPTSPREARDMTVDTLRSAGLIHQMLFQEQDLRVSGHPAAAVHFRLREEDEPIRVISQVYIGLDQTRVAMIQMDQHDITDRNHRRNAELFQEIIASVEIIQPEELRKEREEQVNLADVLLNKVTFDEVRQKLRREQYFLVTRAGRPIGYIHVQQHAGERAEMKGVVVRTKAYMRTAGQEVESTSEFFLDDQRKEELWNVESSARLLASGGEQPNSAANSDSDAIEWMTWGETGTRSELAGRGVLSVARSTPTGTDQIEGDIPPKAYLSQVEVQLLDRLIPHDQSNTYAFYAYNSNAGRLGLRIERVEVTETVVKVHSQVVANQPAQVSVFNKRGELLRRELPDGQLIEPAPLEQIRAQWPERFR